ncbi:hypothetical protein ACHWQZ_G012377 [Mnemiopsis leidyi]
MTLTTSEASMATASSSSDHVMTSLCELCLLNPENPVRLPCSHIFCRDCFNPAGREPISCLCPTCKTPVGRPKSAVNTQSSLADIELELERLTREKEKLLKSKQREIKKMALEFLNECRNQKLIKLKRLKSELMLVQNEILAMTDESAHKDVANCSLQSADKMNLSPNLNDNSIKFLAPEEISNNHVNILKNFPDLENNYFAKNTKYKSIGHLIYNAFRYDSFVDVGQVTVPDTTNASAYIYGMSTSSSKLLSVAGTLKTVNIYNPSVDDPLTVVYPLMKLPSNCFTWSTTWNPVSPNLLAVGDYNSEVKVWDVVGKVAISTFNGHTTSKLLNVSWTPTKPQQLLSVAYESAQIKVWRLNERGSVLNINVPDKLLMLSCKPQSPFHFAVSSVDRKIYSFDLRKADRPVNKLAGHSKSVFQLKFYDSKTLISASVDGTLKQWSYDSCQCIRTYRGHQNTVKFIGLEVLDEYILCGSENNSLHVYHEALSKPVMSHQFPPSPSLTGNPGGDGNDRLVSAITGVGDSVCVANDKGVIRILKMGEDTKMKHFGSQC